MVGSCRIEAGRRRAWSRRVWTDDLPREVFLGPPSRPLLAPVRWMTTEHVAEFNHEAAPSATAHGAHRPCLYRRQRLHEAIEQ